MVDATLRYKNQWIPLIKYELAVKMLQDLLEIDILNNSKTSRPMATIMDYRNEAKHLFENVIPNLVYYLEKAVSKGMLADPPQDDIILYDGKYWYLKFCFKNPVYFEFQGEKYYVPTPFLEIGVKVDGEIIGNLYVNEGKLIRLLTIYYFGKLLKQKAQEKEQKEVSNSQISQANENVNNQNITSTD